MPFRPGRGPPARCDPGDVPYAREASLSMAGGDNIDLSAIKTTVHVGAHTDAPSHYDADGAGIGERVLVVHGRAARHLIGKGHDVGFQTAVAGIIDRMALADGRSIGTTEEHDTES